MTARSRFGFVTIIAMVSALLLAPLTPATAATGLGDECVKQVSALKQASPISADLSPSGQPVVETTLADGTSIPVVMVHGWTGQSVHDDSRDGNFSKVVDLTDIKGQSVNIQRSLIGVIQDAGGATVYTFDYHDTSSRWVTDKTIGRQLANALSCLAAAHGHPAMVVAHSMGGLATREALGLIAKDGTHGPVEANVSDVITYGTPNSGSWLATVIGGVDTAAKYDSLFPAATRPTLVAVRSLITLCGTAATQSMDGAGLCTSILPQLGSATSQAARALAVGSAEMKALPKWPAAVRVQSMAGSSDVEVARIGWFGTTIAGASINLGDFVVGEESAQGGAQLTQSANCAFAIDYNTAIRDNVLSSMHVRLKADGDTKDWAFTGGGSPCFHGNLMRNIEFSNTVLATVAELVDAQRPPGWLIDSTGIGPLKIGADISGPAAFESIVGFEHVFCTGAAAWGLSEFGYPTVDGIYLFGSPSDDAPTTKSGITLGSNESALAAQRATRRDWEMASEYSVYTWYEDGVLFSALVYEGAVEGLGVGTDLYYADYC